MSSYLISLVNNLKLHLFRSPWPGMTTSVKDSESEVALFLHQMIPHHQNAVNMAKGEPRFVFFLLPPGHDLSSIWAILTHYLQFKKRYSRLKSWSVMILLTKSRSKLTIVRLRSFFVRLWTTRMLKSKQCEPFSKLKTILKKVIVKFLSTVIGWTTTGLRAGPERAARPTRQAEDLLLLPFCPLLWWS